jgi:hypothetical protein
MLIKEIIVRKQDAFEKSIQTWAEDKTITFTTFDGKESLTDVADAVVLFHENYTISKENEVTKDLFAENGKFSHSIDVNGTLIAAVSSFVFWLENHKPKNVLFIGDDNIIKNEKFITYLERLADRI